ncbi:terminase small subunit [Erwinia phage Snitter]|nr:terminase small subunit [Erwinia phage Snitter]
MAKYEHESDGRNFKRLYNQKYGDLFGPNSKQSMTPEHLYELAVKYFEWAESSSIKAAETAAFQGRVSESKVNKVRVFTVVGFRLFAGVSEAVLVKWRRDEAYGPVMEYIDSVIYEQKFQLASNGIINASFIGKEMGIDKPASITVETSASSSAASNDAEVLKGAVKDILSSL